MSKGKNHLKRRHLHSVLLSALVVKLLLTPNAPGQISETFRSEVPYLQIGKYPGSQCVAGVSGG
jgi:hypothetical protein